VGVLSVSSIPIGCGFGDCRPKIFKNSLKTLSLSHPASSFNKNLRIFSPQIKNVHPFQHLASPTGLAAPKSAKLSNWAAGNKMSETFQLDDFHQNHQPDQMGD